MRAINAYDLPLPQRSASPIRRETDTPVFPDELSNALYANPVLSDVLQSWDDIALPNCWVVAGAVVQSYWNAVHEFPPLHGISDIDLIYFDPDDLSDSSETNHAERIAKLFDSASIRFDVKNEARVHLWYEARFGYSIEPYVSSESAIDTFPTTAGCIGIRPEGDALQAYTSFGFDDLLNLVVRPNRRQITREIYAAKTARWRELWPLIEIVDWADE